MPQKRTRIINLFIKPGTFAYIIRKITGKSQEYDFSELLDLRKILTHEKAKILVTIKEKNPNSIYDLAKLLGRDFKSVREDIKLLKKFGLVELKPIIKGKRKSMKPIISLDILQINIHFE